MFTFLVLKTLLSCQLAFQRNCQYVIHAKKLRDLNLMVELLTSVLMFNKNSRAFAHIFQYFHIELYNTLNFLSSCNKPITTE